MLIHFMRWFSGYLLVAIRGCSPERFINLCRNRNILIWDLKRSEKGYEFYISLKAFRRLRPIVKKTHTRPVIQEKKGFPFLLYGFRKRKAFLAGIFLFTAILYILSLFIWDISVEGQYEHTEEALIKYLKEINVYPGRRKKEISCQEIEERIRNQYKDIGWVSAEIKGTKLRLKIVETNMPVPYETKTEPCHMVASHDGTVTFIVTRKGTPQVKKGDEVKKGDILISGVVDIIGDNDLLIRKDPVIADGDVVIKTRYPYEKTFPMKYKKRVYTGEASKIYGVSALGKNFFFIPPLNKFKSYEKYDIIMSEKNLRLNSSFVLPFSFFEKKYVECREEERIYTKEEAVKKAGEALLAYTEKLEEKGVSILENHVRIGIKGEKCIASGYFLVEEKAAETKNIKPDEWRMEETDESDGDHN